MAAAVAAAAITMILIGEIGWVKFAAWMIFYAAICMPAFLTGGDSRRPCAIRLPRLWKRG